MKLIVSMTAIERINEPEQNCRDSAARNAAVRLQSEIGV
jgi:hypothetical protein